MNGRDNPDSRDPVSRGHLNPDASPPVARYPAPAHLADLVRQFWVPEWSLPEGVVVEGRVLSHPAINLVVEHSDGHLRVLLAGPATGAAGRRLQGSGWAVGALLRPAARAALGLGTLVGEEVELPEDDLAAEVAGVMTGSDEDRHRRAVAVLAAWIDDHAAPPTPAGLLANRALTLVEDEPPPASVAALAADLGVSSRTLQRALLDATGFPPSEVLRRRRLQGAATRVRAAEGSLADVAAESGFSDHAHMTRAFRTTLEDSPSRFRSTRGGGGDASEGR